MGGRGSRVISAAVVDARICRPCVLMARRARDTRLDCIVAIKILRSGMQESARKPLPAENKRFNSGAILPVGAFQIREIILRLTLTFRITPG
jgi:hypothetical protein